MRIMKTREDGLKIGLSFFLIFGSVLGTIFCNGMSVQMKAELQTVEQGMISAAKLAETDFLGLLLRIMPKRLGTLMLVFLISATQAAPILLMAAAGYFGFCSAALICPLTMNAGIMGVWKYFLLVFPQCMIYIPVMYLLLWWMPVNRKRLTALSAIALVGAVVLGAAAESLINPWFLQFL